jgi:hypothetical protein
MSLPIKSLEIEYEELLKEALSLIPIYAPEWTNHNPSDPGITLIELFAWLCEMIVYSVDQIPEKNYQRFINLLGIQLQDGEDISAGVRRSVQQLSECTRAVTEKDYELLVYKAVMEKSGIKESFPDLSIRAICYINRNLEDSKKTEEEEFGHISIILITKTQNQTKFMQEHNDMKQYVKQYLSERKLITSRIHVVDPEYQEARINMQIAAKDDKVSDAVRAAIENYIDPISGGIDKKGWILGRNLFSSDLYYLTEGTTGVDHVIRIELNSPDLKPYQLIKIKELIIEVES